MPHDRYFLFSLITLHIITIQLILEISGEEKETLQGFEVPMKMLVYLNHLILIANYQNCARIFESFFFYNAQSVALYRMHFNF